MAAIAPRRRITLRDVSCGSSATMIARSSESRNSRASRNCVTFCSTLAMCSNTSSAPAHDDDSDARAIG
jgi:hypothetical protein